MFHVALLWSVVGFASNIYFQLSEGGTVAM